MLLLIFVVYVIWQFSKGPIDLTFAADYVRNSFHTEEQMVEVQFDHVIAEWPALKGLPVINLSNFMILEAGEEKLHINKVSFQVAVWPLLIGQIKPHTITLDNPVIRVIRETDGGFRLLLTDQERQITKPATDPRPSFAQIGESLFLNGEIPDRTLRMFSNLGAFNIKSAKLIAEDYLSGVTWVIPSISIYLNRTETDVDLSLNYLVPGRTDISAINARLQRSAKGQWITYNADLRNVDLTLLARNFTELSVLRGQAMTLNAISDGTLSPDWKLQSSNGTIKSDHGTIKLNPAHDESFSYKDMAVNIEYDRAKNKLVFKDTSMLLNDTKLSISAERKIDEAGKATLPLTIAVPEISLAQIEALWPQEYQDTAAATWLTKDLSLGVLKNIKVTANLPEQEMQNFSGRDVEATFDFENLKVDYRSPLIPVTEAKGSGTIKNDVLDIQVTAGKLADLNINSGSVNITKLTSLEPGEAVINIDLNGPLATTLGYITLEPISLGETLGIDPKTVKGSGNYKVNITFPTIRDLLAEQVIVKVDAKLQDTLLPGIVRGLDLSGGPLDLKVADGAFTISGNGFLDQSPLEFSYSEYIDPKTAPYASDIKAKVAASKKIRDAFGIHLDQFIEGDVNADIVYKEPKPGDVTVDVALDLTPAKVFVDPLFYVKAAGVAGKATCQAILKQGEIHTIRNLEVVVGKDRANGGQLQFGKIGKDWDVKTGSFSTIALGQDNLFSLKFSQPALNQLDFTVAGSRIDGRAFLKSGKYKNAPVSKTSSAVTLKAEAKTMRTGDEPDQIISNPRVAAKVNPDGNVRDLSIDATVGTGAFKLGLRPDANGRMNLKITADDAGTTMHVFDIYEHMIGGTLIVEGQQIPGGKLNDIKGTATIKDFKVVKAPALAQLINSVSLVGFGQLLQNQGIAFTRLRTDYLWKESSAGRIINLSDGRTSGASIGLTFGGTVNQTKGTIDISGTFVPMSEVNKFVSNIPIIGQLLTGGKNGGVIAATYAMKGDSENPSVFINPLSVLTPGFLRSILFEGGMDVDTGDDPDEDAPPAKKQPRGYN